MRCVIEEVSEGARNTSIKAPFTWPQSNGLQSLNDDTSFMFASRLREFAHLLQKQINNRIKPAAISTATAAIANSFVSRHIWQPVDTAPTRREWNN
jgi:hypothetical protein